MPPPPNLPLQPKANMVEVSYLARMFVSGIFLGSSIFLFLSQDIAKKFNSE